MGLPGGFDHLAHALTLRGVPFIFIGTRFDARPPPPWRHHGLICKPFAAYQVAEAVANLLPRAAGNDRENDRTDDVTACRHMPIHTAPINVAI